jgi:hypothetical protein
MSNLTEQKLASLLKNSKAIMNKVEENTYSRGNIDPSMLVSESVGDEELVEKPMTRTNQVSRPQVNNNSQGYRNLGNTKMPKQIVEAMVNNRIDIPETPFHTFDLSEKLVNEINSDEYEEKPLTVKRLAETTRKSVQPKQTQLSESGNIREMIQEEISRLLPKIMAEYFDQRVINEQIQVKVGNTLFSGSLKPLPAKQTKK